MTRVSSEVALADAIMLESFEEFAVKVMLELEPNLGGDEEWPTPWHVSLICDDLQIAGMNPGSRLALAAPPRSLKSKIVCISFVLWNWLHNPSHEVVLASYGTDLLDEHVLSIRSILATSWYQRLGPRITVSPDRNRLHHMVNNHGGSIRTVTRGGGVTGLGADLIIVDDSMKAAEAESPLARESTHTFFDKTLYSRLNRKADGRVIVVQQRLHEDDLIGHLETSGTFKLRKLKAIATRDEIYVLSDGREVGRTKGEALCPPHEDIESLEKTRQQIGAACFEAQYQQNPVPPDGGRIRIEWFETHNTSPARHELECVMISVDTGSTPFPESDYSVFVIAGFSAGKWYILGVDRDQLDFPDLRDRALEIYRRWQPDWMVVESASSGISLIQELKRNELVRRGTIRGHRPEGDKVTRMSTHSLQLRDGRYSLPDDAPWLEEFEKELRAFPGGRNDDQVDALSQLLSWTLPERMRYLGSINPETGRRRSIRKPSSRRKRITQAMAR